jgi:hypothetical protein
MVDIFNTACCIYFMLKQGQGTGGNFGLRVVYTGKI